MKSWPEATKRGIVSGAAASVASTLALLARSSAENNNLFAALNAVSHWIWGEESIGRNRPSFKYTVVGYLVHHGAATFWAVLYEKMRDERDRTMPCLARNAAVTSVVACIADFQLAPHRFTPGYERRLSKKSLVFVYGAFALGLASATLLELRRRR